MFSKFMLEMWTDISYYLCLSNHFLLSFNSAVMQSVFAEKRGRNGCNRLQSQEKQVEQT